MSIFKMSKKKKQKPVKQRDQAKLAMVRREIDLRTKSESNGKKKFSRKEKHKNKKD